MTLTDDEMEARLRRTFAAVAETPLDEPVLAERRRRSMALVAVAMVAVVVGAVLLDRPEPVTNLANQPADGRTSADYGPSPAEATLLFRAEQRLTRECMEAAGQPYPEATTDIDSLDSDWNRLGRTDPEPAARQGYVLPEGGLGGKNAVQDSLKPEQRDPWSLALTGEPYSGESGPTGPRVPILNPITGKDVGSAAAGGCFGEMQRKLYGDDLSRHASLQNWFVNDVGNEVERNAVEDSRFKAAIGSWSSCMKQVGYDYDNPFGPVNEFNDVRGVRRPTERELAVAQADVECKDVTGLTRTYRELKVEHGAAAAARYGRWLSEYRQIVDRALATARTVLED